MSLNASSRLVRQCFLINEKHHKENQRLLLPYVLNAYGSVVLAHTINSRTGEAEARISSDFKKSLVYRVSYRTARAYRKTVTHKKIKWNLHAYNSLYILFYLFVLIWLYSSQILWNLKCSCLGVRSEDFYLT